LARLACGSTREGANHDRIKRASNGNFGDVKPAGSGVSELRIDYGLSRLFFRHGKALVILLCGPYRTVTA
jgi:putative addiction module killer protein